MTLPDDPNPKPGWQTTEWWGTVLFLVKNAILLLVMLGKLSAADAEQITGSVLAIAGAAGLAAAEAVALWRYIASRQTAKTEALQLRNMMLGMRRE